MNNKQYWIDRENQKLNKGVTGQKFSEEHKKNRVYNFKCGK